MDLRRQTEKKEVFASGSDTGNDVTSFKKGFPVPDVRFNKARRMPDEWQKCRAIVILKKKEKKADDLPAVVTLVCNFLYLLLSSHIDSNVPQKNEK